jgi:ketosteroid isomerase-like protein
MKTITRLLLLLSLATAPLFAAEDKLTAAVRAADDERIAATQAADAARLNAIFSDQLHYAHSSGKVDTKASYMKSLASRSTIYESFEYQARDFTPAGPGVVLMTGRVVIRANNDGQKVTNDLNFLAVWREEGGKWRFLAWQSCKNPPPAAK